MIITGLIYDDIFLKHNLPGHPENAERLKAIMSYLEKNSLLEKCVQVDARPATEEELGTCHSEELISLIKGTGKNGLTNIDADTYINEFSYEAAVKAAGGMIDLAGKIADGELTNGIVLSRPPGHHATISRAMGFCLFNTIALGARSCVLKKNLNKVAIVDIDVHHGNGTQWILYDDPAVLYISTHQFPHYPGSGIATETGIDEGAGTTINIPVAAYTGDSGYIRIMKDVILPALQQYQPEFLFVSVGFDAHNDDPLSSIQLTLTGYNHMCCSLIKTAEDICEGRIIFSLEGGYSLDVLGPGIGNIVRALAGDPSFDDPFPVFEERPAHIDGLIESIRKIHNL